MFPLIPALLLILLQGQPALERGRVMASFEGMPWQVVSQRMEDGRGGRPPVAEVFALLRLLTPKTEHVPPSARVCIERPKPTYRIAPQRLASGFAHSERSRDGPRLFS